MESRLLLDVVVRESPAVFQLLASEDQSLLIWWDSLLILDLCLDVFNGVRGLNLKCDCLASEGLHKDLHTTSKSQWSHLAQPPRLWFCQSRSSRRSAYLLSVSTQ